MVDNLTDSEDGHSPSLLPPGCDPSGGCTKQINHKLRVLELAQEMMHNEYVDHKAQLHNEWVINADIVWRTQRTRIKYPSFPAYPCVTEVVARAEVMFAFLYGQHTPDRHTAPAQSTTDAADPCEPDNEPMCDPSPAPMDMDSHTDPVVDNATQPELTVREARPNKC